MILTLEIFGSARNHGKKFLKLCQTSVSGIINCDGTHPFSTFSIPSSVVSVLYFNMNKYILCRVGSGTSLKNVSILVLETVANLKFDVGLVI